MSNTFSDIAKEIMITGAEHKNLSVPQDFLEIAKEVFNVPEKPKGYRIINKKSNPERAILVTGGLDSTVLYFKLKKQYKNLRAFYIDIGQPYKDKEIKALKKLKIPFELLKGININQARYWKHIIPARNFYFFCLVAEQIKGGIIYFATTEGEMPRQGGDKSYYFLEMTNELFEKLPYPVRIETPLQNETKTDLIKWWQKNLSLKWLDYTISCFEVEEGHCGHCQACLRKALAYINNGLKLKTNVPIRKGCQVFIEKYKKLMPKELKHRIFNHYSQRRCSQDLQAIKLLEQSYGTKIN